MSKSTIKTFVHKLRRSSDERKKRWYIGGTVVSMIFIISLWGVYVGSYIPRVEQSNENSENEKQVAKKENEITGTFKSGFSAIWEDTKNGIKNSEEAIGEKFGGVTEKIQERRDIVIEAQGVNFYFENPDALATATLPHAPIKRK